MMMESHVKSCQHVHEFWQFTDYRQGQTNSPGFCFFCYFVIPHIAKVLLYAPMGIDNSSDNSHDPTLLHDNAMIGL